MTSWLQCPQCGEDLFESDAEGLFWEDTEAVCQACGTVCSVGVNDENAYVRTSDEVEDKGQQKCDGSCGAVAEFIGKPCLWDCERA
jgi:transcription initiation factor TFIIIB Brf1 subunit/transcription initiation factor TFIIB